MISIDKNKLKRDYAKNPIIKRGDKPVKDDLEYLYLELNLPSIALAEILNIPKYKILKWLDQYDIKKSNDMKKEAIKQYWLNKYGVDNPRKLKSIQEKTKETNLKKYGVECAMHNKEIHEKMIKDNLAKYGCEYAGASEQATKKRKKTCQEKYGKDSYLQTDECKQRIKQTNLQKYGCENPRQNKTIAEKIKQTLLQRYGCESTFESLEIKNKIRQSILEKYNVEYPQQNSEIVEKTKQTNLKRYGVTCSLHSKINEAKVEQTNLKRYGTKYPIQNEDIKELRRQNNIAKWGTSNISTKHIPISILNIINNKETLIEFIKNNNYTNITQISEHLGISYSAVAKKLVEFNCSHLIDTFSSKYEKELSVLLPQFHKDRKHIYPYEIDLYNDDLKLGIEFNGDYWHSDIYKDAKYHQMKSLLAENNGIFIYHIFEYEWLDNRKKAIILSQINNLIGNNSISIGARKCIIKEVDSRESNLFLDNNHLQGRDKSSIRYGLYFDNELISLMTFCKPRFNKNYNWELSRYCCKLNTTVMGGASKLFKHFLKNYKGNIISYSNISKTKGNLYRTLGFDLYSIAPSNYVWSNSHEILSRYQTQKHKLNEFSKYGSTESEIMHNRGFFRIYDCGNKVWAYNNF